MWTRFKAWIKDLFASKKTARYVVVACKSMPSLLGMRTIGKPAVNKPSIFIGSKNQYRTIKPIQIISQNGDLEIYTEHLFLTVQKIK
jgi:hypothetical protein